MSTITSLDLSTYIAMTDGDQVTGAIWQAMLTKIQTATNAAISAINKGNIGGSSSDGYFYVNGTKTTATDGVVTLTPGATYILKGTLAGKVVIGASTDQPSDDTHIVLNGVDITYTGTDNKAISYEAAAQSLQVTLAPNTINTLVCSNVADIAEQQGACLYSENNMILQGNGYLAVQNLGGHGIKASELRITGNPHIYVDAKHDGVHGNSALNIDGGLFYVINANDGFGTGSTGSINIFGGDYYVYSVAQKAFDSKVAGYIFDNVGIHTDCTTANVFEGMTKVDPQVYFGGAVQNTTDGGYSTAATGTVNCYAVDSEGEKTGDPTAITAVDGVYTLSTVYCEISGYIDGKIVAPVKSTDIHVVGNAYVTGNVEYTQDKKKLQVTTEKDTTCIIAGDITSGSNLSIEAKGGSHLVVKGNISGDELTFNDSKGVVLAEGDVTGKDIYIGTAASADASKFLQGALIVKGTIKAILNSKFTKGWIHVLASNLTGIFSANKIDTAGYADLNASTHVYYHEAAGIVVGAKTVEANDYVTV